MRANILDSPIVFPGYISVTSQNLIKALLNRKPSQRLGVVPSKNIHNSKWFQNFDWKSFRNFTMKAPFIPEISFLNNQ